MMWKLQVSAACVIDPIMGAGGEGETASELGIINSINANGLLVTLVMYLLYRRALDSFNV